VQRCKLCAVAAPHRRRSGGSPLCRWCTTASRCARCRRGRTRATSPPAAATGATRGRWPTRNGARPCADAGTALLTVQAWRMHHPATEGCNSRSQGPAGLSQAQLSFCSLQAEEHSRRAAGRLPCTHEGCGCTYSYAFPGCGLAETACSSPPRQVRQRPAALQPAEQRFNDDAGCCAASHQRVCLLSDCKDMQTLGALRHQQSRISVSNTEIG
jgi:hypothetical protein